MTQPEITSPDMLQGKIIAIDLGGSPEAINPPGVAKYEY